MNDFVDLTLVKEHKIYKYFNEVLEFPENMSIELTIDVLTCGTL